MTSPSDLSMTSPSDLSMTSPSDLSMTSPFNLRGHHVQRRDQRHQVGDHQPARERVDDAHGGEAAGADLHPVRILARARDHVVLHVAARALDAAVALGALWDFDLPRHLPHDVVLLGNLRQALAEDAAALAHLLDAAPEAVPGVALRALLALAEGNVELQPGIDGVGQLLAHVEVHAGSAQVRPDQAVVDGHLLRYRRQVGEAPD